MHLTYVCLSIYLKYQGFARFCTAKYSSAQGDLDNVLMHLTNVAVQKHAEDYNEENGGKWHIKNLRFWLQATCGQEATVGVKRDLLQCQKRLITVSKETYYSVKRDLRSVP